MSNTVCKEHEFGEMGWDAKFDGETVYSFAEIICLKCGQLKSQTETDKIDFHIKENLKVISDNVDDEFVKYLDAVIAFNKEWIFGNEYDADQMRLLEQVKEKYLDIKKKNT